MALEGHIENGQVVLDQPSDWAEGTRVRVEVLADGSSAAPIPSLYERLKPIIGALNGLPSDFAAQHDHYIHGTPKE